jgi:hypothetical protein
MWSNNALALTTLLGALAVSFVWAVAVFQSGDSIPLAHVNIPRALGNLMFCMTAFWLLCVVAYLPIRRSIIIELLIGTGLLPRSLVRPRVRLGWGEQLPLQATFPLGGEDGFPGLHIGELRGDRELFVDALFIYPLRGPFVGRMELATGRAAFGGLFLDEFPIAGVGVRSTKPTGTVVVIARFAE